MVVVVTWGFEPITFFLEMKGHTKSKPLVLLTVVLLTLCCLRSSFFESTALELGAPRIFVVRFLYPI